MHISTQSGNLSHAPRPRNQVLSLYKHKEIIYRYRSNI